MNKPLIEIPADSKLTGLLRRLDEESQPVKDIADLGIINNIRRILGLPLYTVESWNTAHFPSSSLH